MTYLSVQISPPIASLAADLAAPEKQRQNHPVTALQFSCKSNAV